MASKYSWSPKVKRNLFGLPVDDRTTVRVPAIDSSSIYMGGFVKTIYGTQAAPDGAEFGVGAWVDDARVFGFVVGFFRKGSTVPIWDEDSSLYQGTITNETGELPLKYTFSSTNDEGNTTSAKLEECEIMPVSNSDILSVALWGASTVAVARATTTAAGTTNSSDNLHVGLAVDTTYHYALLESGADVDLDDCDFLTTCIDGEKPRNSKRVFAYCMRSNQSVEIVE